MRYVSTRINPYLPGATALPHVSGFGSIRQFGLLPSFATFVNMYPGGNFVFNISLLVAITSSPSLPP